MVFQELSIERMCNLQRIVINTWTVLITVIISSEVK